MQILVMKHTSKYYHAVCGKCGQRIRQGRQYILDPECNSGTAHGKPVPLVASKICKLPAPRHVLPPWTLTTTRCSCSLWRRLRRSNLWQSHGVWRMLRRKRQTNSRGSFPHVAKRKPWPPYTPAPSPERGSTWSRGSPGKPSDESRRTTHRDSR